MTAYTICFFAGLTLTLTTALTGVGRFRGFRFGRHLSRHGRWNLFNVASLMAMLTWFGGAGLVLQRVTTWPGVAVATTAALAGIAGGSVVSAFMRVLERSERPLQPT